MKRILQTLFFFLLVTQICFAQWIQVNGPCGGPVTTLAINSAGDIFAGTREHGVFRSTDNGNNWSQVNNGITDFDIRSIAINQVGTFSSVRVWEFSVQLITAKVGTIPL